MKTIHQNSHAKVAAQHTPGPWIATANGDVRANGDAIAWIPAHYGEGTNQANARLIAAAPDLLAALQELASGYTEEVGIMAEAAIAKATEAHLRPSRTNPQRRES